MASCLVPNCKSRKKIKSVDQLTEEAKLGGKSISFFKFPSCPRMQNIWRNNLFENQTTNNKATEENKICEKHFASTDFIEYNFNEAILKETAVPQLKIKSIEWIKSARCRLANITRKIVETMDIDWLTIPNSSINIECDVKCRFCLKTKKDILLNSWEEISTSKFKNLYLQITGFELHISDQLPHLCCIYCYDRLNEAADTIVYFQECHQKLENFLHEMPKKMVDSLEANENHVKEVILPEILDLNSENDMETIEDEFHYNESRDQTYENEVISPEIRNLNTDNNSEIIKQKNSDNISGDVGKINGVTQNTSIINEEKQQHPFGIMCHVCLEVFEDRLELTRHKKVRHRKFIAKKIYRCDYCYLKFHTKLKLENHMEVHHKHQSRNSLKCQRCPGSRFATKVGFGTHIYDLHPSLRGDAISVRPPAVRTTCKICNKISKSAVLLAKHMYLVHKPRIIPCEQCGKMFVNQFKKKYHQLIVHTKERLSLCEICGDNFKTKSELLNHQNCMHDNDVDRRRRTSSAFATLPCSICDKKYLKLKNIKRHMEKVHKEISKQEWQLLLNRSCIRCNFIFDNEEYLQDHRHNTCNGNVK